MKEIDNWRQQINLQSLVTRVEADSRFQPGFSPKEYVYYPRIPRNRFKIKVIDNPEVIHEDQLYKLWWEKWSDQ